MIFPYCRRFKAVVRIFVFVRALGHGKPEQFCGHREPNTPPHPAAAPQVRFLQIPPSGVFLQGGTQSQVPGWEPGWEYPSRGFTDTAEELKK